MALGRVRHNPAKVRARGSSLKLLKINIGIKRSGSKFYARACRSGGRFSHRTIKSRRGDPCVEFVGTSPTSAYKGAVRKLLTRTK